MFSTTRARLAIATSDCGRATSANINSGALIPSSASSLSILLASRPAAAHTELQSMSLSEATFQALPEGLGDPHSRVRWWCVQVFDHVADPRAMYALVPLLDDAVDRVRRNGVHALTCEKCKPGGTCEPTPETIAKINHLAANDPSAKVRAEAAMLAP